MRRNADTANKPSLPELDRYRRLPEVCDLVGLSRSRIYVLMQRREFPEPRRIGRRAVAWRESDLRQWIETRALASETEAA